MFVDKVFVPMAKLKPPVLAVKADLPMATLLYPVLLEAKAS